MRFIIWFVFTVRLFDRYSSIPPDFIQSDNDYTPEVELFVPNVGGYYEIKGYTYWDMMEELSLDENDLKLDTNVFMYHKILANKEALPDGLDVQLLQRENCYLRVEGTNDKLIHINMNVDCREGKKSKVKLFVYINWWKCRRGWINKVETSSIEESINLTEKPINKIVAVTKSTEKKALNEVFYEWVDPETGVKPVKAYLDWHPADVQKFIDEWHNSKYSNINIGREAQPISSGHKHKTSNTKMKKKDKTKQGRKQSKTTTTTSASKVKTARAPQQQQSKTRKTKKEKTKRTQTKHGKKRTEKQAQIENSPSNEPPKKKAKKSKGKNKNKSKTAKDNDDRPPSSRTRRKTGSIIKTKKEKSVPVRPESVSVESTEATPKKKKNKNKLPTRPASSDSDEDTNMTPKLPKKPGVTSPTIGTSRSISRSRSNRTKRRFVSSRSAS